MNVVGFVPDISQNLAALEARHATLTGQRVVLHARLQAIDAALPELRDLVGEVQERLRVQEGEVFRAQKATGSLINTGRDYNQPTVMWVSGGETVQLSGPRPLDTARGQADHARRVYDALEAEAKPVRAALTSLESERQQLQRSAGLMGGEIEGVEQQISRMRAQEAERENLLGERIGWRGRLAGILRRMGRSTPPRTVQELRAEGLSIRQIAESTGISKSQVQRELGVPDGTADLPPGA